MSKSNSQIVLTGDRPTGRLHIGHYVGSIKQRLALQEKYQTNYLMIADMQALTDNAYDTNKIKESVLEVTYDYLACGIDPEKTTIFIQSLIPELTEFTVLYMNFVTMARVLRNPTVKHELELRDFGKSVPIGFINYPISQAADITAFNSTLIPVGDDQLPMIEQTNEIVRHINYHFNTDIMKECKPILSKITRLPGIDGNAKMSKSLNNCIYLSDDKATVSKKVMSMYTDPNHLRVEDPGQVEGNPVFTYLDAFDPNQEELKEWKAHYQRGGLGDVKVKRRLEKIMQDELSPIRERRALYQDKPKQIMEMLLESSEKARKVAQENLFKLKRVLGINY
ncbi:MAG TPA: tryptophan--tRNA ligase [Candidatus Eisenbacteria bacterium]|nr:tryptophan--tRNA ligase [Candidatus Eisenbacteria bacterium]